MSMLQAETLVPRTEERSGQAVRAVVGASEHFEGGQRSAGESWERGVRSVWQQMGSGTPGKRREGGVYG